MHIRSWSEIDAKAPGYFKKINELSKKNRTFADNLTFIVVDHCLQTFESHIDSLNQLGKVAGVILKSSTRVKEAEEYAKKNCNILDVTKESLKDPSVAIDLILKNTKDGDNLVIMDHGGYFSYVLKDMMEHKEVSKRLIGIAEVTENGHYKMKKALEKTPMPTLSVARSAIKELEDAQTGVAICDASNSILYSVHSTLNSLQNVCVLGYGKIGRSIANACRKRGITEVTVIEIDALRAQSAIIEGHKVVMASDLEAKAAAFQKAQILFSATGAKALTKADVALLKKIEKPTKDQTSPVLYIASCTSPDDEFSEGFLKELRKISKNSDKDRAESEEKNHLSPYEIYDGRKIYILNEGKAVNFALGGTPGFEICQVWGGVLYTAAKLAAKEVKASGEVQTLSHAEELSIAEVTQSVFFPEMAGKPKATPVPAPKKPAPLKRSHSFTSSSTSMWSTPPSLVAPTPLPLELTPKKDEVEKEKEKEENLTLKII